MSDPLSRLRADVDAEMSETGDVLVPGETDVARDSDRLLADHFAAEPAGQVFLAALEALSRSAEWPEAPAGRAASSASSYRSNIARTVGEALRGPGSDARSAVVGSLNLNHDAADRLLDLPAAALLRYPASAVARLADRCGCRRGELFRAIADSSRMSGGYVYAYRPGPADAEPAKRAEAGQDHLEDLIAWGRELFEAAPPGA